MEMFTITVILKVIMVITKVMSMAGITITSTIMVRTTEMYTMKSTKKVTMDIMDNGSDTTPYIMERNMETSTTKSTRKDTKVTIWVTKKDQKSTI